MSSYILHCILHNRVHGRGDYNNKCQYRQRPCNHINVCWVSYVLKSRLNSEETTGEHYVLSVSHKEEKTIFQFLRQYKCTEKTYRNYRFNKSLSYDGKYRTSYEQYLEYSGRRMAGHNRQIGAEFVYTVNTKYQYSFKSGDH